MARIMCARKLWHALGESGRPPHTVAEPSVPGAMLGSWSARLVRMEPCDLAIALNQRTYLTLVFSLHAALEFRPAFAGALRFALAELRIPERQILLELAALEAAPLARNTDRGLTDSLNDLEFYCEIELSYENDLRLVQMRLNEIPHRERPPHYVPITGVRKLFAEMGGNEDLLGN